jgi:hypothetical protein
MTDKCERLEQCGFFQKYGKSMDLICTLYSEKYCNGPQQCDCKRKQYFLEQGKTPIDEMLPSGQILNP